MKNRKGFTLVELLAVITILSVILIIAVPQIMNTIKVSKLGAMESSAKIIAKDAEKKYYMKKMEDKNYAAAEIPCTDITKMSSDYGSCTISYSNNGIATVTLRGASGGKFDSLVCQGTKNDMNCEKEFPDAATILASKIGQGGLIEDEHGDLRYQGNDPDNYVTFNDEEAGWRIIGLFNVDGEQRIKLVKKDSIGSFSWDSSVSINQGQGINQWGASGTYPGADLMQELNGDYLNSTLLANTNWYNGSNDNQTGVFNKNYVLKASAQALIGQATWYTGGIGVNSKITLADAYAAERGTKARTCTSGNVCNDEVERTYTWRGIVGLIYPSDLAYASGDTRCATNISYANSYCYTNWMSGYGWTITPTDSSIDANRGWLAAIASTSVSIVSGTYDVRPSVYLISGVQMKGSGTTADPYVFAE